VKINNLSFNSFLGYNKFIEQIIFDDFVKNKFNIIVSGGRSVKSFINFLDNNKFEDNFNCDLFLSDEYVENDIVLNTNVSPLKLLSKKLHFKSRFNYESQHFLDVVNNYDNQLSKIDCFDSAILGVGEDGHISSLFEKNFNKDSKSICNTLFVSNSPKKPKTRITISYNTLGKCKKIILLYLGKEKENVYHSKQNFFMNHLKKINSELIIYRCLIKIY
jgi:6-phosphogluconolactonase/glucosamine-6-phosphate isomerase/deaminase